MVKVFSQSVAKYKLCYTQLTSDSDSKSFAQVRKSNPYGDMSVEKISCVGHVQKLMTACPEKIPWGKTYYGLAIRASVGDVDAMHNAVMVILLLVMRNLNISTAPSQFVQTGPSCLQKVCKGTPRM